MFGLNLGHRDVIVIYFCVGQVFNVECLPVCAYFVECVSVFEHYFEYSVECLLIV